MEFIDYGEALGLLKEQGIQEVPEGEDRICMELEDGEGVVHLHMACSESTSDPHAGAELVSVEKDRIPGVVEHILHKLHLSQVLLIPVSKWRHVFDAVAFSMAENDDWQAVDTAGAVALNTRDPLLCEPADFHTISEVIKALLSDAERPEQGLMITTTATPFVVELIPDGVARISIGNRALADEVAETFSA
ncbi:MAG: hypothetical protein ACYSU7_15195 [Planctomycetota bacterium]